MSTEVNSALPASGRGRKLHWRLILGLLAFGALALPTAIGMSGHDDAGNELETAVVKLGFFPIRPPSTLRGPGSIFHVNLRGEIQGTVCEVSNVLAGSVLRESPTELTTAKALRDATYDLDAGLLEQINTKLVSKRVESVRLEFTDVKVREIAGENLVGIASRLQRNPDCKFEIERLLRSRELVCQGTEVLLASVEYDVAVKADLGATSKVSATQSDLEQVRDALSESDFDRGAEIVPAFAKAQGGSIDESHRLTSGRGLYYGIKLSPLCLTPNDADREWRIPRNWLERAQYYLWQRSLF